MYDLPVLKTPFNTLFGAIATGTAVACTLLATLNACWAELREQPASLMLPRRRKRASAFCWSISAPSGGACVLPIR